MVVKTGVSLPDELYQRLQDIARRLGYQSVSRAIRDAVELFIAFNAWWSSRSPLTGVLLAVVEAQTVPNIVSVCTSAPAVEAVEIRSIGGGYYATVLWVHGDPAEIRGLYNRITRSRGVVVVQPALVPVAPREAPSRQAKA